MVALPTLTELVTAQSVAMSPFDFALVESYLPSVLLLLLSESKLSVEIFFPFKSILPLATRPLEKRECIPAVARTPRPIIPLGVRGISIVAMTGVNPALAEATSTGGVINARDSIMGDWLVPPPGK